MDHPTFQEIELSVHHHRATLRLNRPQVYNALSLTMMQELGQAVQWIDQSPDIKCTVLLGCDKAFAAGVDIHQMRDRTFPATYVDDLMAAWHRVGIMRKPLIAGVTGYALGGGFELAMMADILIAGDSAIFGQPEITVGTIPGIGGSQRLPRLVGKHRAMDMILTGRRIDAQTAYDWGIVSRLVPTADVETVAYEIADHLGALSLPLLMMAKDAVLASQNLPLVQGLDYERRLFQATFGTIDQKEGMTAFQEKRQPVFRDV